MNALFEKFIDIANDQDVALDATIRLYIQVCFQDNEPVVRLLFIGKIRKISNRRQGGEERLLSGLLRIFKEKLVKSTALPLIA